MSQHDRNRHPSVALYARVSSERQDVDLSIASQLRALREHSGPPPVPTDDLGGPASGVSNRAHPRLKVFSLRP